MARTAEEILDKFQPALPMRGVTAILCAKFTASINI